MKKFNELSVDRWYQALMADEGLEKFSELYFELPLPNGLLSQGYESWMGYLCRTDVPVDYSGRALEAFLMRDEHLRSHSGPHPLLCGYNLVALELYVRHEALPSSAEEGARLFNHWVMGAERGWVSTDQLKSAKQWLEKGGVCWKEVRAPSVRTLKNELKKIDKANSIEEIDQGLIRQGFGHHQVEGRIEGLKGHWSLLTAVLAKFSDFSTSFNHWFAQAGWGPVDRQLLLTTRIQERWTGLGLAYHFSAMAAESMRLSPDLESWHRFRKDHADEVLALWNALLEIPESERSVWERNRVSHRQFSLLVELPILREEGDATVYVDPWAPQQREREGEVLDLQLRDILKARIKLWFEVWSSLPLTMSANAVKSLKTQCYEDELNFLSRLGNRVFDGAESQRPEDREVRALFALYMRITGMADADLSDTGNGPERFKMRLHRGVLQKTSKWAFNSITEEEREQALRPWVKAYMRHDFFRQNVDRLAHEIPADLVQRFKSEALNKHALGHVKPVSVSPVISAPPALNRF